VSGQLYVSTALPLGKEPPVPIVQDAGWPPRADLNAVQTSSCFSLEGAIFWVLKEFLKLLHNPPGRENKKEGSKFMVIQVLSVTRWRGSLHELTARILTLTTRINLCESLFARGKIILGQN
jgi:hypothetical protein